MTQKYGNRRQKAKAETRRVILEAAYSLFEKKGYEKTTMRELAATAEVGLGTIFQHFPEKTMLAAAAFEDDMEDQVAKAFATLPKEAALREQLLHFGRSFYSLYALRPQLFRVVMKVTFFDNKETAERIDSLVFGFLERLSGLFQEAIDRGEIRSDTDILTAVTAFWAYYTLTLMIGLRQPVFDTEIQVSTLGALIDQHFQGLRRPPA